MAVSKLTAIFGSSRRVGRWKVAKKSQALVIFGRCEVDFREAYADPDDETISLKIFCLFGSVTVLLPEGASVQPSAVSVLSSSRLEVEVAEPSAELPTVILATTTVLGRCHATTTAHVEEEIDDPLEDWALRTPDIISTSAEATDFSRGLPDPNPMPQLHQKLSMGANARLGEMESAWIDGPPGAEAVEPSDDTNENGTEAFAPVPE